MGMVKNIITSSNSATHKQTSRACVLKVKASKLAVIAREKEGVRKRLSVTAKKLAVTAKEKEAVRKKLAVIAGKLAITAKEKEDIRNKLAVTAEQLAVTAREKENVRKKLAVTAQQLKFKAEQLVLVAKEKENVRKRLAVTAEKLAMTAKEKEIVRGKLAITAKTLRLEDEKLAVFAENLAESKAKEEAILSSIGDGMVAADSKGRVLSISKATEGIIGWSFNELKDKNFNNVVKILDKHGKVVPPPKRPLYVAFTTGKKVATAAYFYVRKDGTRFPVAIVSAPTFFNGKITGSINNFQDITKERNLINEKEDVRKKLEVTAKNLSLKAIQLAVIAKEKESIRGRLEITAKRLATTAKDKEDIRKKLAAVAEEKEIVRKRLAVTAEKLNLKAKQLVVTAQAKESVRRRLAVTAEKLNLKAKQLVVTAKEKEDIRNKLAVTAEQLALSAKEKEDVRRKLALTAEKLKLKAEQLILVANEKERVRRKLEVTAEKLHLKAKQLALTAKEKESVRRKLVVTAGILKKSSAQLAVIARERESVRRKLVVTAEKLKLKAEQLALTAKEKESVRRKLEVTAEKLHLKAKQLALTAREKEDVRRKLVITAEELKLKAQQLVVTAREKKEKEKISRKLAITAEKLDLKAKQLAVTAKEREDAQSKLVEHTQNLEQTRYAITNILEDLTAEKESLAKAKVKDEAVLESIGDGVIATDNTGIIILINRAAETLLGYKSQELLKKKLTDVINLEDAKGNKVLPVERPIKSILGMDRAGSSNAGASVSASYFFKRKDGIRFPVALTVAPIILNNENIGAVEVFRDITKEKEVDRAKSEFVSIASHQLRTPLTGIHWLTELLEKEKLTDKGKEFLNDIKTSVQRLNALVELLLNISRIEEGKIEISPESIDVVSFIKKIVDSLAVLYSKKKLSLTFTSDEKKMNTMTDVGALQNIAQAILANAFEYTPQGGKIAVNLKKRGINFLLTVSDTGIGIPLKDQSRIFQKFSRASNAESVKAGGMGMGLWITKQAADLLGGKIWFKSPSATLPKGSAGTTFFVELPLRSKLIKGTKKLV
jgi:PAS domain S-box-containing protein